MQLEQFRTRMAHDGWVIFPSVLPPELISRLNRDLAQADEVCHALQVKNGVAGDADSTVHHLVGLGDSFLELLEVFPLYSYISEYFEGQASILNSLGGIINQPAGKESYASRVHRDIRTFSGTLPLMLNTLVMLDDFTPDNGATYLDTGSHLRPEKPTNDVFFARADRALGKAGSVLFFNSNLWHAAGHNGTQAMRRAITPTFTRPFIKQQCDYPRLLGYDRAETLSDTLRQVLGYHARVPASLEEWYQPPEKRMYKRGQG